MTEEEQKEIQARAEKLLSELRGASIEFEENLRKAEAALRSFPDPDSEPDTDDAEIEAFEEDYVKRIEEKIQSL